MNNFNYYAPTKVAFGKDTEKETGRLVKEQGATSVLVHFGGKSAIASGLIDRVCQSLAKEGIAYETLGGVVPNPRLSKVREGIALCKEKKCVSLASTQPRSRSKRWQTSAVSMESVWLA